MHPDDKKNERIMGLVLFPEEHDARIISSIKNELAAMISKVLMTANLVWMLGDFQSLPAQAE